MTYHERQRLDALHALNLLDTPEEACFDDIAALAAELCTAPIALVSLVDADRQWFKARVGLEVRETDRASSFCAHALEQEDRLLVVEDAARDARFATNPLVTGAPNIRFYAGAPIVTSRSGVPGTVCIIDTEPRRMTPRMREILAMLARQVAVLLDLRERSIAAEALVRERDLAVGSARRAEQHSAELLKLVLQAGGDLGFWDLDVSSGRWSINAREAAMLGYSVESAAAEIVDWRAIVHPDDRAGLAEINRRHYDGLTPFSESVHRLRHRDGHDLWVADHSMVVERHADGRPRRIVGTHRDITERKRSDDLQKALSQRFELALAGGDIGLWDLDVPSGRTVYNAQWWRIVGFEPGEIEAVDGLWRDMVHPDDYDASREALIHHARGGTPMYEGEVRVRHKDGRYVWVQNRAKVVERSADGTATRIVGITLNVSRVKETQIALERTHDVLRRTAAIARVGGWELSRDGTAIWSLETFRIHEAEPGDTAAVERAIDCYAPDARVALKAAIDAAWRDGTPWDFEARMTTAKGRPIWVRTRGRAERAPGGAITCLSGTLQDITERRHIHDALADEQRRLRLITDSLPALIMHIDRDERFTFANGHFDRVFGIDGRDVVGHTLREVCGDRVYADIAPHVAIALSGRRTAFEAIGPAHGKAVSYESSYVPDIDATGTVKGFFAMTYDVTERRRHEEMLLEKQRQFDELARIDPLTGLANRRAIEAHLDQAIARSRRTKRAMAAMYLDVDHFKSINDRLGHAGGDAVLRQFASRLHGSVRATDLVARYAGDEFLICLEGLHHVDDVSDVAAKIVACMRGAMTFDDHEVVVTTSIGVAVHDGVEAQQALLRRADEALYRAKTEGRNRAAFAAMPGASGMVYAGS